MLDMNSHLVSVVYYLSAFVKGERKLPEIEFLDKKQVCNKLVTNLLQTYLLQYYYNKFVISYKLIRNLF